jgi:hypothetical protein
VVTSTPNQTEREALLVSFAVQQSLTPEQAMALPALWDVLIKEGFDPASVFKQAATNVALGLELRRTVCVATGGYGFQYSGGRP